MCLSPRPVANFVLTDEGRAAGAVAGFVRRLEPKFFQKNDRCGARADVTSKGHFVRETVSVPVEAYVAPHEWGKPGAVRMVHSVTAQSVPPAAAARVWEPRPRWRQAVSRA